MTFGAFKRLLEDKNSSHSHKPLILVGVSDSGKESRMLEDVDIELQFDENEVLMKLREPYVAPKFQPPKLHEAKPAVIPPLPPHPPIPPPTPGEIKV